ncbi:MAG: OmpA family protein [Chitinophagales bacterium]|nr:OmpA family protein [Chitinophagales bacterium]
MKKLSIVLLSVLLLSSCVTSKKYNQLEALSDKYLNDKQDCENRLRKMESNNDDCEQAKAKLQGEINTLKDEKAKNEQKISQLEGDVANYRNQTADLTESKSQLLAEATSNQQALNKALAEKEAELNRIAAQQKALDETLKKKESDLAQLQTEIALAQKENEAKNKRIGELEAQLKAKEEAIANLKTNVTNALKGFSSDEVQVTEKDGNLHVALSENLLFKSGSFTVDTKGEDAIKKIASVLNDADDFTIVVEGHTDNVPYNGTGQLKDNWDLSVKRATSVVRILTDGGVNPAEIAASGRGEFHPVKENDTKENKAANRRTEIILSPKLGKILDILNK